PAVFHQPWFEVGFFHHVAKETGSNTRRQASCLGKIIPYLLRGIAADQRTARTASTWRRCRRFWRDFTIKPQDTCIYEVLMLFGGYITCSVAFFLCIDTQRRRRNKQSQKCQYEKYSFHFSA